MLRESRLLLRMAYHLPGYCLFGDRGYDHGYRTLQVPFRGVAITAAQRAYNYAMSKIRLTVEWSFGKVARYFAFVDFKKNQKLYMQPVAKYYLTARHAHDQLPLVPLRQSDVALLPSADARPRGLPR